MKDRQDKAPSPTPAQRAWLTRGLDQPGHKLPLFDAEGREVAARTVAACIEHGWAEPWTHNPIFPQWRVCKLSAAGIALLKRGREAV